MPPDETTEPPANPGIRSLTPYLAVKGADAAIDWYRDAFGAEEVLRWHDKQGRVTHSEIRVAGSPIFVADEVPDFEHIVGPLTLGGSPVLLDLDVEDVDAVFDRAIAAGATIVRRPDHPDSGVQAAKVIDPFGHVWLRYEGDRPARPARSLRGWHRALGYLDTTTLQC